MNARREIIEMKYDAIDLINADTAKCKKNLTGLLYDKFVLYSQKMHAK